MAGIREKGKARRKDQIIQTAKRLIATGGIDALSTRKLADEAELSVHTLYALVGSKEQILDAVMEDNHNRVLGDILQINAQHPIDRIFGFVDSTYRIISEDSAAQKPLMRALMILFDEGRLNPRPWWLLAQERGWMESAVSDAIQQSLLRGDFTAASVADLLMKIYLANLREYLFDRAELAASLNRTVFEFWFCLSSLAAPDHRDAYLAHAKKAASVV